MKNYIAFVRDHSISMAKIREQALNDYNGCVRTVKEQSRLHGQQTRITVAEVGYGSSSQARLVINNHPVESLQELLSYPTSGAGTPLWDGVGEAITACANVVDAHHADVSFLIMVTTDGEENSSRRWTLGDLQSQMNHLQQTGRWSFVFRVPKGKGNALVQMGIPADNILEWEQTAAGQERAQVETQAAFAGYYEARAKGATSTSSFYASTDNLRTADVEAKLQDVTLKVEQYTVDPKEHGVDIRSFVERSSGRTMQLGEAYYQLTKPEKAVQDHKDLLVQAVHTGRVFAGGQQVRALLGLPTTGTIAVHPGKNKNYEIFVQSTSNNRKLVGGTRVIYAPRRR